MVSSARFPASVDSAPVPAAVFHRCISDHFATFSASASPDPRSPLHKIMVRVPPAAPAPSKSSHQPSRTHSEHDGAAAAGSLPAPAGLIGVCALRDAAGRRGPFNAIQPIHGLACEAETSFLLRCARPYIRNCTDIPQPASTHGKRAHIADLPRSGPMPRPIVDADAHPHSPTAARLRRSRDKRRRNAHPPVQCAAVRVPRPRHLLFCTNVSGTGGGNHPATLSPRTSTV